MTLANPRVANLQEDLAKQLGYVATNEDPILALAYAAKQIQEDQHAAMLQLLEQVQTVSRTLTAEGREQIANYASELGRRLGNELRLQVSPETVADRVVMECGPALSGELANATRSFLAEHADTLGKEMRGIMSKHDEHVFWHVDQRLAVHSRISTRNTIAQCVLTVAMAILAAAMLYDSHRVYRAASTHVSLPVEAERAPAYPPAALVEPPPPPKRLRDAGR